MSELTPVLSVQQIAALRLVLEGFDKGVFVRDISHDHESGWAIRQLPYLRALGHLTRLLETLEPFGPNTHAGVWISRETSDRISKDGP